MLGNAPIRVDKLADALDLGARSVVALVGGGGKTTLLHALAGQLPGRVIATTTTRMSANQHGGRPFMLNPSSTDVQTGLDGGSPLVVWRRIEGNKAIGFETDTIASWTGLADHIIVEADGSRRRPFKAPGPFEPAVPATTTDLVSVIGADAIGKVILDQCHRPLRVAGLAGCRPGERLTAARAATVLLHPHGMRRALPGNARFHIVVTKVDNATAASATQLVEALRTNEPAVNVVALYDIA